MSATMLRTAALLLPLAGCVNMSGLSGESKYACAAPEGVACDSVSGTYANALHHNLPSQRASAAQNDPQGSPSRSMAGTASPASTASAPPRQAITGALSGAADASPRSTPGLALRSQARVLRLWTKPWEDADGDLWDQGYVYVQVDTGRWQINHVRQRIRDQYAPLRPPPTALPGGTPSPSGSSPAEPEAPNPAEGAMQRPASFNTFPSLARPPASLGPRPQ